MFKLCELLIDLKPVVIVYAFTAAFFISGCSTPPPDQPTNICQIFKQYPDWYDSAREVYKKRGVPINIVMAFIYHESGYVEDVRPPMRWFLFIPYGRGSTAYGYPQAQDDVWDDYVAEDGGFFSSRDDIEDAMDFVSWYIIKTVHVNKVPMNDVYNQYLNYHEGWQGYRVNSYAKNSSLKSLAGQITRTSKQYADQMRKCNFN